MYAIVVDDVASSNTVTRILDKPEHVELDEDNLPCPEAAATATNVDAGSSRPVTHDDTPVCLENTSSLLSDIYGTYALRIKYCTVPYRTVPYLIY